MDEKIIESFQHENNRNIAEIEYLKKVNSYLMATVMFYGDPDNWRDHSEESRPYITWGCYEQWVVASECLNNVKSLQVV